MADNPDTKTSGEDALLETARKRFKLASESETSIRAEAMLDMDFRAGNQWPAEIKNERASDSRPCLVINRIPQFIRQVTNDQRQNRPALKVHPVDDKADPETARIYQGIIRHIESNSNADVAYDTAFDGAVTHGRGFIRVITDYTSPTSFDQELIIKRVRNPFTVYMDPGSTEPDGSDMNWCFITEELLTEDYKAQYKGTELASMDDFTALGDEGREWTQGDKIRIAEYFYKDFEVTELHLLNTGEVVAGKKPAKLPEGVTVVQTRKSNLPVIKWAKINAAEVIEERTWVGQWIPVVPVIGDELDIDGKLVLEGIVRHARDSQRMYNYWASSETETIALAPRAPFIGAEGQFEGHETAWQQANRKNQAYLQFKPVALNGTVMPAPQRQVYEAPVQAITMARMHAADDLKSTTGIYDTSLGAKSNESSGIAIQRRNMQAQTSNFHFVDNLSRSLRHLGRILVDAIPKVYDTARTQRIIGEDGKQEIVRINEIFQDKGKEQIYDLGAGKYDVAIETGPSYATKRQEGVAAMLELTAKYPKVAEVAGDLMVQGMEWPGASEIAERLKKTLPPGLVDDKGEKAPLPPEAQQQMSQMDQMIQQLTDQLNKANQKLETKSIELESRERIEMAKVQANLEIEMAKMGSVEALAMLKAEISQIENRLNILGQNEAIQTEFTEQAAPQGAVPPPQTPTGGFSPGNPMEQS